MVRLEESRRRGRSSNVVGSAEANPAENKLSNESPSARRSSARRRARPSRSSAPRGSFKFKILDIKAAVPALALEAVFERFTERAVRSWSSRRTRRERSGTTTSAPSTSCSACFARKRGSARGRWGRSGSRSRRPARRSVRSSARAKGSRPGRSVHAAGEEGARAVAARGALPGATTTSAPSTSGARRRRAGGGHGHGQGLVPACMRPWRSGRRAVEVAGEQVVEWLTVLEWGLMM